MIYRIEVTARAEMDADATVEWLSQRSRLAAARWHAALELAVKSLEILPYRCGRAPEAEWLGIELRELLFGKRRGVYRVIFVIEADVVRILHIRHSAQDLLQADEV